MYSATLHPLPPLVQEMLNNPPEELLIHRYTGMKDLEIACEPIAEKLGRHEREEQLMIVTHFPGKYIEDGGDIVRRRVYKPTRNMYFWEHHLPILQFRPCNQYCWVSNTLLNFCRKWEFEYKTERGIPRDDVRNRLAMVYSTWPDGYIGQHSARESAFSVTPMSGLKKQLGTQSRSNSSFPSPSNDLLLYIPFERWPSVVFEHRSLSALSIKYADFGLDWWFHRSQGLTKVVILYYIDNNNKTITFEKWVCDIHPPDIDATGSDINSNISTLTNRPELPISSFKKKCERKYVYTVGHGFNGNPIVFDYEIMFCRPRKTESDKDLVFEDDEIQVYVPYGELF